MTLFKDTADIRTIYPDLESDAIFTSITPYLEEAAELYLYSYISQAFYDELVTALTAANYVLTSLTAAQQAVVQHLRRAQWYFGYYLGIQNSITTFGGSGAREISEDGSSQPRQWVFNSSKGDAINKADLFLDRALQVLESAPASYTTWRDSTAFTLHHKYLITTVDEIQELGGSRRTFKSLMQFIKKAEDRYLEPSIGPDLLTTLKTKQQTAGTFTAYETKVLEYLKDALRYYALYLSGSTLRLKLTDQGLMVASTDDGIGKYELSAREDYGDWKAGKLQDGEYYLNRAKNYLELNADQFSDYNGSTYHKNKQPTTDISYEIATDASSVMT